ncbi:Transport and Golgi organization protein 2-like protein [Smittium culicis]|uniref:Transport and Golgi organization protein 2-like protein n=1 Tax=Smittium culicis TaxID=133412 RepID=A0A1R1YF53_9FUNG|nr:Transport and Golgi organization protein 2-like protein [Smittium culicis]
MCIVFWKLQTPTPASPYKFIFAGNRDEFFNRPTQLISEWNSSQEVKIVSPLDLMPPEAERGSWIGINELGRVSFLTNFSEKNFLHSKSKSRGLLVRDFLESNYSGQVDTLQNIATENLTITAENLIDPININPQSDYSLVYLNYLSNNLDHYNGFNLVTVDIPKMKSYYISNRNTGSKAINEVENHQIQGLSNSLINCWPKVERGKSQLDEILKIEGLSQAELVEKIFSVLRNPEPASESNPPTLEQFPESIFIPKLSFNTIYKQFCGEYGTRSSCVILVDNNNTAHIYERYYNITHQDISGFPNFPEECLKDHSTSSLTLKLNV